MKDDCNFPLFNNSALRAKTVESSEYKTREIPQQIAIIDPDI